MQPHVTKYPLDHMISLKLLKVSPESKLLSKGLNGIAQGHQGILPVVFRIYILMLLQPK